MNNDFNQKVIINKYIENNKKYAIYYMYNEFSAFKRELTKFCE